MINKKTLTEQDAQLFREHMKHVRPLKEKHTNATLPPSPLKNTSNADRNHHQRYYTSIDLEKLPYFGESDLSITAEESLWFLKSGLQPKKARALKKGQLPLMGGQLDLHGETRDEALVSLQRLFARYPQGGCLCIIHGKGQGKPVLKNVVNHFLRQHPRVLAFSSAPQNQGGTGAVLVLIKRESHAP